MWTRFYSLFWYEKIKKNTHKNPTKRKKRKSCAFQCKFSPLWLWFLSYELLYIVNCNIRFFLLVGFEAL